MAMRRTLERVTALWAILGGLVLLLLVAVTAVNAAGFTADRIAGLFGGSVAVMRGYEDLVRLLISAAAPMLFPYCQIRRGHIAVDIFIERMPAAIRRGIDTASLLAMAGLTLFLAYWMWFGMTEARADGLESRVLGWPEWPFYLPGMVSLLLWAIVALVMAVERAREAPEAEA